MIFAYKETRNISFDTKLLGWSHDVIFSELEFLESLSLLFDFLVLLAAEKTKLYSIEMGDGLLYTIDTSYNEYMYTFCILLHACLNMHS